MRHIPVSSYLQEPRAAAGLTTVQSLEALAASLSPDSLMRHAVLELIAEHDAGKFASVPVVAAREALGHTVDVTRENSRTSGELPQAHCLRCTA
jgi:hypothetical protein